MPHSRTVRNAVLSQSQTPVGRVPPTSGQGPNLSTRRPTQPSRRAIESANTQTRRRGDNWSNDQGQTPYSSIDILFEYLDRPGKLDQYLGKKYRGRGQTKREWARDARQHFLAHQCPKDRDIESIEVKMRALTQSYRKARDWMSETGRGGGKRIRDNIEAAANQDEKEVLEGEYTDKLYKLCKYYDRLHPIMNEREGGTAELRTDSVVDGNDITLQVLSAPRDAPIDEEGFESDTETGEHTPGPPDTLGQALNESQTPGEGIGQQDEVETSEAGEDDPPSQIPSIRPSPAEGRRDGRGRRVRGQVGGLEAVEKAVVEANARDTEVQREAVEVQEQAMEINREDIQLKQKLFELEVEKTASTIATQRVSADPSVSWLQAVGEAREMLRGHAREARDTTGAVPGPSVGGEAQNM